MAHLVVLGVDSVQDAERTFAAVNGLAEQQLLELEDAAYAWKDDSGKVRVQHTVGSTGAWVAGGAMWGTLIGAIALVPVAGLAVGAGAGALMRKLTEVGISEAAVEQVAEHLNEGKAAVFLLARSATVDRAIEALRPFHPTIIQSNLTKENEQELLQALQS
jgi:uncharacterized membrane protein